MENCESELDVLLVNFLLTVDWGNEDIGSVEIEPFKFSLIPLLIDKKLYFVRKGYHFKLPTPFG
jgi:hypothetical protein